MPRTGQPIEWVPYPGEGVTHSLTSDYHWVLSEERGGTSETSFTGALGRLLLDNGYILYRGPNGISGLPPITQQTSVPVDLIYDPRDETNPVKWRDQFTIVNTHRRRYELLAPPSAPTETTGAFIVSSYPGGSPFNLGVQANSDDKIQMPFYQSFSNTVSGTFGGWWQTGYHIRWRWNPSVLIKTRLQFNNACTYWFGVSDGILTGTNISTKRMAGFYLDAISNATPHFVTYTCDASTPEIQTGISQSNGDPVTGDQSSIYWLLIEGHDTDEEVKFYIYNQTTDEDHGLISIHTTYPGGGAAHAFGLNISAQTHTNGARRSHVSQVIIETD